MKYLLDTHAVLWIAESSPRLSPKVRALAGKCEPDDCGVAAISLLEIAGKAATAEIVLKPDAGTWLNDLAHRFRILPLTPGIAWRSVQLDWNHRDPANRLICATALEFGLKLVTHDKTIKAWGGVEVLW